MSAFQLQVEPFGGTSIDAACFEAVKLATQIGVTVGFDFNGVHCMAKPNGDAKELARKWGEELKRETPYKVVSA